MIQVCSISQYWNSVLTHRMDGPRRMDGECGMILLASSFARVRVGIYDRKCFYAPELIEELQCKYLRVIQEIFRTNKKWWICGCPLFFGSLKSGFKVSHLFLSLFA